MMVKKEDMFYCRENNKGRSVSGSTYVISNRNEAQCDFVYCNPSHFLAGISAYCNIAPK